VRRRQRLAGGHVCDAGRGLDPAAGPLGHDDRARDAGCDDGFEEMLGFCHPVA
jgi:hypothetical protein